MNNQRPIMFVGTASDVGKSVLCAGICRLLKQDGYHPAPFKGQNMSNNSYATPDGLEIGRAQAVQAEAAQILPQTDMNPILLKPSSNQTSQLVINGKPCGKQSAFSYFKKDNRAKLFEVVLEAFNRLNKNYAPIVIEGAGSISELNLKSRDITNMRLAIACDAATFLVADIDKGGVFASVYGSIALLSPEEKQQIKGIIINKFRGDIRLFEDGKKIIEELTGIPVVGVVPYFKDIYIEEEDAVSLAQKSTVSKKNAINIAVVLLERISNFTDFNRLERDSRVHLYYSDVPSEIEQADIIILPGSKNTIADLINIRKKGLVRSIYQAYQKGKKIIGICGGYQMLGQSIEDPYQVEGTQRSIPGIGLLPIQTVMEKEKTTVQCQFKFKGLKDWCKGYEIHMGVSTPVAGLPQPLNELKNGKKEGYFLNQACWGSYIHGIFDNPAIIDDLLEGLTHQKETPIDSERFKNEQFDKLATVLRESLDIEYIKSTIFDTVNPHC
ncbi:cobyric acid synthase [Aureispira anguillae]|uniref:Cobyric acid synthase n=1 Tax=Aureispira anguillae TaxID=2864201 RepID=A0A916DT26_9BACT|nr:cobyric acid synthase [Aureispira anguillae]BDS11186.1 cobyric acid synthase [Aureispira anguillae]